MVSVVAAAVRSLLDAIGGLLDVVVVVVVVLVVGAGVIDGVLISDSAATVIRIGLLRVRVMSFPPRATAIRKTLSWQGAEEIGWSSRALKVTGGDRPSASPSLLDDVTASPASRRLASGPVGARNEGHPISSAPC